MLEIKGLTSANSSEATFGNMICKNNKLIIPYFNINIIDNSAEHLGIKKGNYLKKCYLIFENIYGIVWDYELSRFLPLVERECYGGINYFDNKDYEFWISYKTGRILIHKDFELSKEPWDIESDNVSVFFNSCSELIKYL